MIEISMRCNRDINGEQQVSTGTAGELSMQPTRELTLVSTDEAGKPFEAHVQHATLSGTFVFPKGMDATEYRRIVQGNRVRVTIEVVEDDEPANSNADTQSVNFASPHAPAILPHDGRSA